jgi:hypothetical protein
MMKLTWTYSHIKHSCFTYDDPNTYVHLFRHKNPNKILYFWGGSILYQNSKISIQWYKEFEKHGVLMTSTLSFTETLPLVQKQLKRWMWFHLNFSFLYKKKTKNCNNGYKVIITFTVNCYICKCSSLIQPRHWISKVIMTIKLNTRKSQKVTLIFFY